MVPAQNNQRWIRFWSFGLNLKGTHSWPCFQHPPCCPWEAFPFVVLRQVLALHLYQIGVWVVMERKRTISFLAATKRLIHAEKTVIGKFSKLMGAMSDPAWAIEMSFEKPNPRIFRQQGFSIDNFSKMVVCGNGPLITNVRFGSVVTQTPNLACVASLVLTRCQLVRGTPNPPQTRLPEIAASFLSATHGHNGSLRRWGVGQWWK